MSSYQQPPGYGYPQPPGQQPQQQQPQQQGYPQQGVPQQQFQQQVPQQQYPQPQPGYPQQQPQQQGYPQQQAPQSPPAQSGPPVMHAVDEAATAEAYQKAKESLKRGSFKGGFLTIPGPNGEGKWGSDVPPGYEGSCLVHICGPWQPGGPVFVERKTYFYKSPTNPKGASIGAVENGLFARAVEMALAGPDEALKQRAKDFGRIRRAFLYNVIWLENVAAHMRDGEMRPFILEARQTLHAKLGTVFSSAGGISTIIDYQHGRPMRIIKKKTGPEPMNVDWDAVAALNPSPLPQDFWPAANNLNDLSKLVKMPTEAEEQAAIAELGLPMPGIQVQVPGNYGGYAPGGYQQPAYQAAPNPPHQSPYMAPQGAPGGQPVPPQGLVPPAAPAAPQGFQGPPQGLPPGPPAPPAYKPPQQPPVGAPPPTMDQNPGYGAPPQGPGLPPMPPQQGGPETGPPPGMAPPPVSSSPQQAQQYQPQPASPGQVQEGVPVPSQNPNGAQPGGEVQRTPIELRLPISVKLEGDRERCFGSFVESDKACEQCPSWIKNQCVPASGGTVSAETDNKLHQLQQELAGQ